MGASSVRNLCRHLISSAIQRCRMSGELCRLSVVLKSSARADPPIVEISISDTGIGSCLEEFQDVKYPSDSSSNEILDGLISVATTSIRDDEISHYEIDLKQQDRMRRLKKLPPRPKSGAIFSGTEVSLSTFHNVDSLLAEITCFLRKILIMKIPKKVGIELMVEKGGFPEHQCVNGLVANECVDLPAEANISCLKSGFEDYVLKHENQVDKTCHSCFSRGEQLKIGSGVVCSTNSRNAETRIEAVVIISEPLELKSPSCSRTCGSKTEVLYFKDFSPVSISESLLNALASIDWRSYGLVLKSISDEDGCSFLEWENLPPDSHIDIAIHCQHTSVPPSKEKIVGDRNLTRKAVKLALNDLKEKNTGAFLSAHAIKIRSYAPDLARTLAGLIMTSYDWNFRRDCASLLGVHHRDTESFEDCIKQRLFSVIDLNDREPRRSREAAPFLFQDDYFQEPELADEEYEEGEESLSSLDL